MKRLKSTFFICLLTYCCFLLSSWKQETCNAQQTFKKVKKAFKTFSKDDYCVIISIANSVDKQALPTNYVWHLGDGNQLSGIDIEHCYKQAGNFEITLFATSLVNQVRLVDTSYYQVNIGDFAILKAQPTNSGHYYFETDIQVSKNSKIKKYYWDFGDGNFDCSTQSPTGSHQYETSGKYTVRLIVEVTLPSGKTKQILSSKTFTITV